MREVFNLFSFDSVVQVVRLNDCLTCTTESKENKLKPSLIEIMRLLFNNPIIEINIIVYPRKLFKFFINHSRLATLYVSLLN